MKIMWLYKGKFLVTGPKQMNNSTSVKQRFEVLGNIFRRCTEVNIYSVRTFKFCLLQFYQSQHMCTSLIFTPTLSHGWTQTHLNHLRHINTCDCSTSVQTCSRAVVLYHDTHLWLYIAPVSLIHHIYLCTTVGSDVIITKDNQ